MPQFGGPDFDIMAFPSGQFLNQEYNSDEQIREFATKIVCKNGTCSRGAGWTTMSKVNVNGPNVHPVWRFLKSQPGCEGHVMWNFDGKFLVSRDGKTVQRLRGSAKDMGPQIKTFLEGIEGTGPGALGFPAGAAGANSAITQGSNVPVQVTRNPSAV